MIGDGEPTASPATALAAVPAAALAAPVALGDVAFEWIFPSHEEWEDLNERAKRNALSNDEFERLCRSWPPESEHVRRDREKCAQMNAQQPDAPAQLPEINGAELMQVENWHYVESCWDSWSEDEDPAAHDIWQATSDGFVNIRNGARRQEFPPRVVHGRKLIRCGGCGSHFRCMSMFSNRHCASRFAHIGGRSLPVGPIPDAHELEDNPALCPSAILTLHTPNCVTANFTQIVHYVALREHQNGITFAEQPSSVVLLVYPDSPWDEETQQLWTRDRRNAAEREQFRGLVAARNAALAEANAARKEAEMLKGIVLRLMQARREIAPVPAPPITVSPAWPAAPPHPIPQPAFFPENLGKRPAEGAPPPSLGPLTRARISVLSRAQARAYLKSMGSSAYGEPAVLKQRLQALFDANRISEYFPGSVPLKQTKL